MRSWFKSKTLIVLHERRNNLRRKEAGGIIEERTSLFAEKERAQDRKALLKCLLK